MTNDKNTYALSRRKALAALGTIGAASAGAGLGTSAWFSDRETFEGNTLTAGSLDLKIDWQQTYTGPDGMVPVNAYPDDDDDNWQSWDGVQLAGPDAEGDIRDIEDPCALKSGDELPEDVFEGFEGQESLIQLDDVKPGDEGEITFSLHLCDNPGYVWMNGTLVDASENGFSEPESEVDSDQAVELLEAIRTTVWYDTDCDNVLDEDEVTIFEDVSLGTALQILAGPPGIPLDPTVESAPELFQATPTGPGTCSDRTTYDTVHTSGDTVTVDGTSVTLPDNPGCGSDGGPHAVLGLETAIKIESEDLPGDGNSAVYTTAYGDIEITQDGQTIQWRTDSTPNGAFEEEDGFCVSKVVVKGGNAGGNVYSYDNDDGDDVFGNDTDPQLSSGETEAWLETPSGQDISHVSFCVGEGGGDNGNGGNGNGGNGNGHCIENSTTHCVGFKWWLPLEVGNEIQTDSVEFDLGFYTEQCRHNPQDEQTPS